MNKEKQNYNNFNLFFKKLTHNPIHSSSVQDLFAVWYFSPLSESDGAVKVLLAEEMLKQQVKESHTVLPGLLQHGRQFVVWQVQSTSWKQLLLAQPGRIRQRHLRPLVKHEDSVNDRLQVL